MGKFGPWALITGASAGIGREFATQLAGQVFNLVLVVSPGATDTSAMGDLGFKAEEMPMKPMSAGRCAEEALAALEAGKSNLIPGRVNRVMKALVPSSLIRSMMGKLLAKANGIQL